MDIFKNILSIRNDSTHKVITLLGVKIKFRRIFIPDREDIIQLKLSNNYNYWNDVAKIYHKKIFKKYEGIYKNQSVVLFACGPSAKFYEKVNNSIHVGINYSFVNNPVHLDYLVIHDNIVAQTHFEELKAYDAKKFYAYHTNPISARKFNTDTNTIKKLNAIRFFISDPGIHTLDNNVPNPVNPDIANGLFFERGGGTVFSALQFILYTQPSKIYLVGCDCTKIGHFNMFEKEDSYLLPKTQHLWEEFKYIKNILYPALEVISINPVNLKGLFKDVYTQSYVDANPKLKGKNIEII